MGCCKSKNKVTCPAILPTTERLSHASPQPSNRPNPPIQRPPAPASPAPKVSSQPAPLPAPPYPFPATYSPDTVFPLHIKNLTGSIDFTVNIQGSLKGRELYAMVREKVGEGKKFGVLLYGKMIPNDQEEVGKSGLSVTGTAYCMFEPEEKGN